jgi:hypothetical protein
MATEFSQAVALPVSAETGIALHHVKSMHFDDPLCRCSVKRDASLGRLPEIDTANNNRTMSASRSNDGNNPCQAPQCTLVNAGIDNKDSAMEMISSCSRLPGQCTRPRPMSMTYFWRFDTDLVSRALSRDARYTSTLQGQC